MKTALIITGIVFLVWFFLSLFTSKPIPEEYLTCFIGGLGSGKTYLAVRKVVRWFKRSWRKYSWSVFFHPVRKLDLVSFFAHFTTSKEAKTLVPSG